MITEVAHSDGAGESDSRFATTIFHELKCKFFIFMLSPAREGTRQFFEKNQSVALQFDLLGSAGW